MKKLLFGDMVPPCRIPFTKQLLLTMKLTAIILLAACLTASARGNAQNITLSEKNAPLEKIFREIKRQTGYSFLYSSEVLKQARTVDIDVRNATLAQVLNTCFVNQPLSWELEDKTVIVKPKPQEPMKEGALPPPIDVKGRIVNENGDPVLATVQVKGDKGKGTTTNDQGFFELKSIDDNATLVITGVGIETFEVKLNGRTTLALTAKIKATAMGDVTVTVNTGYQQIPKERATGSFVKINNELFNRSASPDIISRLRGVTPSLLFDERSGSPKLNIRGLSTILANDQPLIVVDNFPFNGDINTINPNDVEDISILRDAAASSIWGVRAGNGVIVITTKKGTKNRPVQVGINTNLTIGDKPDLFYQSRMSTSDFIDVEKMLFDNGYFDATINNTVQMPSVSPVVEILLKARSGVISQSEATSQLNALRNFDVRNELNKHFYKKSVNQQYAININGGTDKYTYYFSSGFDRNLSSQVGNQNNRISLNTQQSFRPIKNLEINAGLVYTQSQIETDFTVGQINMGTRAIYPYARLTDNQGNPVPIIKNYREGFSQQAMNMGYLNWDFNPIKELSYTDRKNRLTNIRAATGIKYSFIEGISAEIRYQYETQVGKARELQPIESYGARDLINRFTRVSGTTITRGIPVGGILTFRNNELVSHNGRAQVNVNRTFNRHGIVALAGIEVREVETEGYSNLFYGYDPLLGSSIAVNYAQSYQQYPSNSFAAVPGSTSVTGTVDRFRSYFANAAYTYNKKYTLSLSGRIDQSNLFGVNANQRSNPLWSAGAKWDIDKESFYNLDFLPVLKLKATYGYSGNIDQTTTAFATANFTSTTYTGLNAARISNPPNPELRWEKIGIFNLGFDFGLKNDVLTGSIEFYKKKGVDLFGQGPLDPTTGFAFFKGNIASIKGRGWDIELNSANIRNKYFKWTSNFFFNYATEEITKFELTQTSTAGYFADNSIVRAPVTYTPVVGKPLFAIYSLRWAGLDPITGAPRGWLNRQPSTDYVSLISFASFDSAIYHGRAMPSVLGALRNTIDYKGLSLSVNITYRFGYYFRRTSVDYNALFSQYYSHGDYANRWQKPGDESFTNVPSMVYPANASRDIFYQRSEVLVEKGDHIRLQDIQLSYQFNKAKIGKLAFKQLQFYCYINNIGILWRANKAGLDPDYQNWPAPKTYAVGIRTTF